MSGPVVHLCFHGVGTPQRPLEPGEDAYWIGTDTFHRVLDLAAEDPRVRLSFDDGNASDVEIGLPALLERGLVATFFVLAGRLDTSGSLTSPDVRRLAEAGMGVGSHGMHHVPWRGLDAGGVDRELVDARVALAAASGRPVHDAALPLGRYDRRTLARVRAAGYRSLATSDRRWTRDDAWLRPRFSVRRGDTADDVRRQALAAAPWPRRARSRAVGAVKALR